MITEKISNGGVLSGTINASSNLTMGIGSSNNLVGGNINTFTKEIDPTIPDYIKAISKENIAGWDNNAVVNEEQNKTLVGLEELIDTITPKNTAKGELVHITDALCLPTFENKVDGNVKQETIKGKQLFDYKDRQTISTGITTDEDGWITATIDNSNGTNGIWCNFWTKVSKHLKPSTKYKIVLEVKQRTGTLSSITVVSYNTNNDSQFKQQQSIYYSDLTKNSIHVLENVTKDDFANSTNMLRTFVSFSAGNNGSITFRLSVLEDITITADNFVYEKYTGGQASPNPEFQQPIEVLEEGYNLFNKDTITENNYIDNNNIINNSQVTNLSDYISINSSTSYTLSYDYSTLLNSTHRTIVYYDQNKIYISGINYQTTNKINTITTPSNAKYLRFSYDKNCYDIQLTKGTTKKPYFPYGCVGVKNVGKNLYAFSTTDKTNNISGVTCVYDSKNQELTINGTSTQKEVIFRTKPWGTLANKTYTITIFYISGSITGEAIWYNQDGNANWSGYDMTLKNETISLTKTYDVDLNFDTTSFIRANDAGVVFNNYKIKIMIEENPIATPYEPYQEQIVYLDLKGNWAGATKDAKDLLCTDKKKFWLDKVVDKYIFDGSEQWFAVEQSGIYRFVTNVVRNVIKPNTNIICTHFLGATGVDKLYTDGVLTNPASGAVSVYIEGMTLEEFKTFAKEQYDKGTPITLVYELAEPYTEDLGELPEPIKTFEGTNNIQVLANIPAEIEVKYALDVKKYADDRYLELTNALVSTGANL